MLVAQAYAMVSENGLYFVGGNSLRPEHLIEECINRLGAAKVRRGGSHITEDLRKSKGLHSVSAYRRV